MNQSHMRQKGQVITAGMILPALLFIISCTVEENKPKDATGPEKQGLALYKDKNLPADKRIADLLERLTLEEKVEQLSGIGNMDVPGNERLGIPTFKTTDGPVGVGWEKATAFPASVALASTWDTSLILEIGKALGQETRERGRDVLLAPCVNIHRFPVGGRNFESFGEDPYLSGEIAESYVKGVQSQNIIACVKHYAGNNQEWNRMRLDVEVDERTLREIYLPMFKSAVIDAGAKCVMSAYNKINGQHCTENPHLLQDILKGEWGFEGFVVSDWGAVESTVPSANAGNDLEMPRAEFWGDKLVDAVKKGDVKESVIDDKLKRILRARIGSGTFDRILRPPSPLMSNDEHEKLALEAAKAGIVLLKNEPSLLPIDKKSIKSLALIGSNAKVARIGGGGSSEVVPFHEVSPFEGLGEIVGEEIELGFARGTAPLGDVLPIEAKYFTPGGGEKDLQGLRGEYFRNNEFSGEPEMTKVDPKVNFNWGYKSPFEDYYSEFSIRWTGKLKAPKSGMFKFVAIYDDGIRLTVGEKVLIDHLDKSEKRGNLSSKNVNFELKEGEEYDFKLEYVDNKSLAQVQLGWEIPGEDPIEEAVELAKKSDMAIVFAGLSKNFESEDKDRERLDMPNQDRLIDAVVAANPKTIVVIETGTPVSMGSWYKKVPSIMQAWFPGQEGGRAIAELLFGLDTPSAKLPCSFIAKMEDCPAFEGYRDPSLKAKFQEGVFVGYRYLDKKGIAPLFPFGHGLSYTTFEYSNLKIEKGEKQSHKVSLDIKNTGSVVGKEVVQVYVEDPVCSVERPQRELKAFAKIELKPGEQKTVNLTLEESAFSFYDVTGKTWKTEPGEFIIHVGSSSRDIRLKETVKL